MYRFAAARVNVALIKHSYLFLATIVAIFARFNSEGLRMTRKQINSNLVTLLKRAVFNDLRTSLLIHFDYHLL